MEAVVVIRPVVGGSSNNWSPIDRHVFGCIVPQDIIVINLFLNDMRRHRDIEDTQEVQYDALQQDVVFEEVKLKHRLCFGSTQVVGSCSGRLHSLRNSLVRDDEKTALPFQAGKQLLMF